MWTVCLIMYIIIRYCIAQYYPGCGITMILMFIGYARLRARDASLMKVPPLFKTTSSANDPDAFTCTLSWQHKAGATTPATPAMAGVKLSSIPPNLVLC